MKWFDKWFANKCKQAWEDANKIEEDCPPITKHRVRGSIGRDISESRLSSNGVNFTMYQANGGTVVELRSYDHNTDRHSTSLYVISADDDLGKQLEHIVTLEALKR